MDIKELKELIDATIYPNGEKKIKASSHQSMLHEIVDYTNENITTINSGLEDVKNTLETQGNDVESLKESSKQTELNDAKVNQKIDNLASNIVGLGGDIKGSVKGTDVIELPNIAINGVAPNAKIEGLTLVNVAKNGNFSNVASSGVGVYWKISSLIRDTYCKGGMQYFTNDMGYGGLENETGSLGNGVDKFYLKFNYNSSGNLYFRLKNNAWQLLLPLDKYIYSNIHILKAGNNNDFLFFSAKEGSTESFGVFTSINLTQMFGKGNEPTKEWCDKHIKGYIDGMQSVQTPLRFKSIGANLFDVDNVGVYSGYYADSTGRPILNANFFRTGKIPIKGVDFELFVNSNVTNGYTVWEFANNTALKQTYIVSANNFTPTSNTTHIGISFSKPVSDFEFINLSPLDIKTRLEYDSSISYINSEATLKSALKAKDYIDNGTLFKNVFTTKEFKKDDIRRQYINESLVNTYAFYFDIEENKWLKDGFSENTNRIAIFSDGETYSCVGSTVETDIEDIIFFIEDGRNYIMLKINKSKIDGLAGATPLDKFKAYMGNRLLIINYQANTEQIKLDISGVVTTKANGTIFIENVKNVTDFYTANGLDVKDFKELVSIYKYEGSDLIQLDAPKAVFTTTLKHPDLKDGDLVFFEYKYLDSPLWGDNEIEYFNKNNVLQSENGKLWQKIEKASNEGVLTTELKEIV